MIRETSRKSYYTLNDLGDRQRAVYEVIHRLGLACNLDIAIELGIPINSITPRTNELVSLGLVEEGPKKTGPSGRQVIYWQLKKKIAPVDWDKLRIESIRERDRHITNSDQISLI